MDMTVPKQRPGARAADLRRRARDVLNQDGGASSHRLTLTLAVVTVLTAGMTLYVAVWALYTAGLWLWDEPLWVEAIADTLLVLLLMGLVLPLVASLYRLACLMTAPDGAQVDGLPVSVPPATLLELFYPFTSLRAYARTMAVAMEGLAWLTLSFGLPVVGFRILWAWVIPLTGLEGASRALLIAGCVPACLAVAFGFFLLSGRRAGFGYWVFVHESMSMGDVNRYFGGFRPSVMTAFCLRVSLAGWYALSVAAVLIPFVFHTLPYTACCAAVYGRDLSRS